MLFSTQTYTKLAEEEKKRDVKDALGLNKPGDIQ